MKPLILPKQENQINQGQQYNRQYSQQSDTLSTTPVQKISVDDARQIAREAAQEAANTASNESFEKFNMYQQQQNQLQRNSQQNSQPYIDNEPEIDMFDQKTAKSVSKTLRAFKDMQEVFQPPADPIRGAMENAVTGLATRFAENLVGGGLGGGSAVTTKKSFLIDIMNTAAAHGFGESLGNNLPGVIQSLTSSIGQKKTQELVDNLNSKINSGNPNENSGITVDSGESSTSEKQKDMIIALSVDNPEHIAQYASAMSITQKAAKGMLQIHQDDIRSERSAKLGNISNDNNEITQALSVLIKEMTGMKETINNLNNKIVEIESKKVVVSPVTTEPEPQDTTSQDINDNKWDDDKNTNFPTIPVNVTNRSVNLFSSPIKVDVDAIKGDNLKDSFFDDKKSQEIQLTNKVPTIVVRKEQTIITKKEPIKESVLEEKIDSEGNSTFKMSDENLENDESSKKEFFKSNEELEKVMNETYKDDSDSSIVDETQKIKETPKVETSKLETQERKKIIIKKSIPIKKTSTEHYDINNNLMNDK